MENRSDAPAGGAGEGKDVFLALAQSAYDQSTSFVDNNYRKKWEDAIRHFQNRHHAASKYNKSSYKYRSKIFRPKTRSVIRNNEAAGAAAFFGNMDLISIEPRDSNDLVQKASADINKSLVQYRLQETIPWFVTCIGALQDAQKVGVVCSYQHWDYKSKKVPYKVSSIDPITGEEVTKEITEDVVLKDGPVIKLLPVENVRIHPASDWTDPVGSSPYLIILWPMFVKDVKARMKEGNPKTGEPKWKSVSDGDIEACISQKYDSTRTTREENREDKTEPAKDPGLSDFSIVWVHENIIANKGQDIHYYTLGTQHRLTDPVPIEDVYFTGQRPVVMGTACIETHKIYPDGIASMTAPLQKEINENANQRADNVKFVLNKRWFVRRGAQVDLKSITRNVPGSVTLTNDPTQDVVGHEFHDVTSSAYAEQDRLNVDFDELAGNWSTSSLMTNRKLNETVGGMSMLRSGSTNLTEYLIRTFSETWLEPVMKQLVALEQKYETDAVVLSIAAKKAKIYQKYGIDRVTDELLDQRLTIVVDAGLGATDPMQKLEKLLVGVQKVTEVAVAQAQLPMPIISVEEVGKEMFGRLGFKDGSRFMFQKDDQGYAQMAAMIQMLQQQIQQMQMQLQDKSADRQFKMEQTQLMEQAASQRKAADIEAELTAKAMDLQNPVPGEKIAR